MSNGKKRALIYGAGNNFIYSAHLLFRMLDVVGIVDGDAEKQGTNLFGYEVQAPEGGLELDYDILVITPSRYEEIAELCLQKGVDKNVISPMREVLGDEYRPRIIEQDNNRTADSVAILLYGGMGDFIVEKSWVLFLLRKLHVNADQVSIYIHEKDVSAVQGLYSDLFDEKQIKKIDLSNPRLLDEAAYDVVFWVNMFPAVMAWNPDKLRQENADLYSYVERLIEYGQENYVPNLFASSNYYVTMQKAGWKEYSKLADVFNEYSDDKSLKCCIPIKLDEDKVLSKLRLQGKAYITLNTGLNAEFVKSKKNLRAWSIDNWKLLAAKIRADYPGIVTVQLGNNSSIADIGADINLCGKTSLDEVKVVLKHATLHVDYEGGLVHLRHAVQGGTSVVLFGPTSVKQFNYEENIPIRTNACPQACAWHYKDWFAVCHHEQPGICMQAITPEMVFERVKEQLHKNV